MKDTARVVIVGGGAMGVSLLYHLTKLGWTDAMLIEKNELTAGSTWHAAGLCTHFAHNFTIQQLRAHSVRLYRSALTEETGQPVGFHACGALRITRNPDRMDEFRHVQGLSRFSGYDLNILSPGALKEIYPLVELDGLLGAIHEPDDGFVDPSQATQAMAAGARSRGAAIHRQTAVTGIDRTAAGEWRIRTDKGDILADHVVNAAGTWGWEVGRMLGLDLPMVPMLHQYLVTDGVAPIAERIAAGAPELPIIRDPEESWYLRQERDGFICGPYEKNAPPWSVDGVPPEFGMELLPPDLERMEDILALAMARVPALADAGIKTIVNGPITFTPDGNPLIGPAFDLDNAWLLTGSSMGVMEGGGAGWFLADWIVNGEPPMDALAVDSRRFGGYADRDFRLDKAKECFGLQFGVHYPFEERPAARKRIVTPLYDAQAAMGAVFGAAYGWERPNWFRPPGTAEPPLSFRRPGWFDAVAAECLRVRDRVGLADISAFAKFALSGPDAEAVMAGLGANRPPQGIGRIALIHALSPGGGVEAEFTVTRLAADRYYLTSAAGARRRDLDLLRRHARDRDVTLADRTEQTGILALMGPMARAVLARATDTPLDNTAFPWLSAHEIAVAGIPVLALRLSYVGELGWELHAPLDRLADLHGALTDAGRAHDIGPFGAYAMNAMRLEKGYRAWGLDFTTERTPLETGAAALVRTEGRAFPGREAMLARHGRPDAWSMQLLEIEDRPEDGLGLDPFFLHPVIQGGRAIGMVTSAAYGHRIGRPLALAYFREPPAQDRGAALLHIEILGRPRAAAILAQPPYDPDNARPRA